VSAKTVAVRPAATVGLAPAERAAVSAPSPSTLRRRRRFDRPVGSCVLLLLIYLALSFALNDPRGTLGTDTGGKLATLHAMSERGAFVPDVSYWAESRDRTGILHPLYYTYRVGDHWVNVTTLPMLDLAYPLFLIGGDRCVLLLPMLGAVLGALAARALARRLGGGAGMAAFWTIGLATPVAIYALDFWEHSVGLALMLWAVVLLFDVYEDRAGWRGAVCAGLLFGAAATMRTEALVYLVVATATTCLGVLFRRRSASRAAGMGVAVVSGAAVVLVMNQAIERLTLGNALRSNRVGTTAAGAASSLVTRFREALTTLVGLNRFATPLDWIVGGLTATLVAYAAWRLVRRRLGFDPVAVALLAAAAVLVLVRGQAGLGFVPGLLTASPFAAAGIALGWRHRSRFLTAIACASLPIVWLFQYTGGANPQWGGRYELVSGALLATVAVAAMRARRIAFVAVLALSVGVTAFGLAWLSARSHGVADGMEHLLARHDQAVISLEGHLLREGGAFYDADRHWLTASSDRQLRRAVAILSDAGDREVAVITPVDRRVPSRLGRFTRVGSEALDVRIAPLRVFTYKDSSLR
jgi:hypothetical protein